MVEPDHVQREGAPDDHRRRGEPVHHRRAGRTRVSVPDRDPGDVLRRPPGEFIAGRPDDGAVIRTAINQEPKHYQGGWLLDAQGGAEAITFGNSAFYKDSPPSEETFIHELVHISQYYKLGRSAFLVSYFGLSLATIIKRAIAGQPIEAMKSSPHERDAYDLETRFKQWRKDNSRLALLARPVPCLESASRGDEPAIDREEVGLGDRARVRHRHAQEHLALTLRVAHGPPAGGQPSRARPRGQAPPAR